MDKKIATYIFYGLWGVVAACLVWLFISAHIYALLTTFLCVAATLAWWGAVLGVTPRMRAIAMGTISGFWTVIAVLMFFPFSPPDAPEYIVGEVHRFSEMNHGFARAMAGVLGPKIANHGLVYEDAQYNYAEIYGMKRQLWQNSSPGARALFGATVVTDMLRAPNQIANEPQKVLPYPLTTFEGAYRDHKIGWNPGDELLADVAKKVGYKKARYTPEENALMVKALGKFFGSIDVGICRVDPRWFFTHDLINAGTPLHLEEVKNLKYGIQVFSEQNWTRINNDPGESWWSITKSGTAYSNSAWIAVRLAQMLRDMGYEARVGHGGQDYETVETPFSVYNGFGEFGRMSDAVVPAAGGARFKSATILTNFPMQVDAERRSYGVTRFCGYCDRCARACPVNAIPMGGRTVENGIEMWHVDKDRCARFRVGNLNGNCCNECVKVCPYNKPPTLFHLLGNYVVEHSPIAGRIFGSVGGLGLEDWLDYDNGLSEDFGVNEPARWILEDPGYKNTFPRLVGQYIFTEADRSPDEEWATGVGAEMGKVGVKYQGVVFGEIPKQYFDANGRPRNVHKDYPEGEQKIANVENLGRVLTQEEAEHLLKTGQAFTGGWYKKDEDVYPPRSPKYEKGRLSYAEASKLWVEEE
ncbi:MAG: 4Fe-4S dicluster domain-containing protein [Desulfovibrio sp.]|jgi:ferredoxin|nr:4Fe-4S dicluster domain-containing protein [Desulfovibrio sp.]